MSKPEAQVRPRGPRQQLGEEEEQPERPQKRQRPETTGETMSQAARERLPGEEEPPGWMTRVKSDSQQQTPIHFTVASLHRFRAGPPRSRPPKCPAKRAPRAWPRVHSAGRAWGSVSALPLPQTAVSCCRDRCAGPSHPYPPPPAVRALGARGPQSRFSCPSAAEGPTGQASPQHRPLRQQRGVESEPASGPCP